MSNITLTIDSARLDFAVGVIEGATLSTVVVKNEVIDKKLIEYNFTPIEITLTRQMLKQRLAEVKDPKPKKKVGRRPKAKEAEPVMVVPFDEETIDSSEDFDLVI